MTSPAARFTMPARPSISEHAEELQLEDLSPRRTSRYGDDFDEYMEEDTVPRKRPSIRRTFYPSASSEEEEVYVVEPSEKIKSIKKAVADAEKKELVDEQLKTRGFTILNKLVVDEGGRKKAHFVKAQSAHGHLLMIEMNESMRISHNDKEPKYHECESRIPATFKKGIMTNNAQMTMGMVLECKDEICVLKKVESDTKETSYKVVGATMGDHHEAFPELIYPIVSLGEVLDDHKSVCKRACDSSRKVHQCRRDICVKHCETTTKLVCDVLKKAKELDCLEKATCCNLQARTKELECLQKAHEESMSSNCPDPCNSERYLQVQCKLKERYASANNLHYYTHKIVEMQYALKFMLEEYNEIVCHLKKINDCNKVEHKY